MELNISEKKTNPFFKREEVQGTVSFERETPSRNDVGSQIAIALKTKPELVIVRKIAGIFGDRKSNFTAFAYQDQEALDRTESEVYKKRNERKADAVEEKKENATAQTENKPTEKVEEKKEVKQEEKKEATEDKQEAPSDKKEEVTKEEVKESSSEEQKE